MLPADETCPACWLCDPGLVRDWLGWHDAHDDPASSLARRLEVVKCRLGQALDSLTTTRPELLSLCSGDGRDVIAVLAGRGLPVGDCRADRQRLDGGRSGYRGSW